VAATIEAGASRTTPTDGTALGSTAVGATVSLLRPWTSAGASLSWSRFGDGGGSLIQGGVGASAFSNELASRVRLEAAVTASLVGASATTTARLAPTLRLHLLGNRAGAWVGGGFGAGRGADSTRGVATAEGAIWLRQGPVSVTLLAVPTRLSGGLAYVEGALAARYERGGLDLLGTFGARGTAAVPAQAWANLSIAAWFTDQLAILASSGRYPDDPIQAFSGGRFLSVGLRLATRRPDRIAVASPRSAADLRPARPDGLIRIEVEAATPQSAERVLRVTAPGASRVELRGDVTTWTAVPMRSEGEGRYVLRRPLEAGPQRLVIRIDGGSWLVPSGTTRVADEFGEESGLLVVP